MSDPQRVLQVGSVVKIKRKEYFDTVDCMNTAVVDGMSKLFNRHGIIENINEEGTVSVSDWRFLKDDYELPFELPKDYHKDLIR